MRAKRKGGGFVSYRRELLGTLVLQIQQRFVQKQQFFTGL